VIKRETQRKQTSQPVPDTTPSPNSDRLLTPKQVAEILGLQSEATLAVWRCTKRYELNYIKVGRRVMYRIGDVEKFIASRCVQWT